MCIFLLFAALFFILYTIEFEAMPKFSFRRGRKNSALFVLVALCLALIVLFPEQALFPLAVGYVLSQLGRALVHSLREEEEETLPEVSVSKRVGR